MGIFNEHSSTSLHTISGGGRGPRGVPGIGWYSGDVLGLFVAGE